MEPAPTPEPAARPAPPDPSLLYEPPAHAHQPAWPYPPGPGAVSVNEQNWAMIAHLSSLVTAGSGLGFLGPLFVLLAAGDRSPFVRRHAVEALNFNITVILAVIVSGILALVLIGFLMLLLVGVGYVVATIAAAMAANRGQDFRYPLTVRFVR